MKKIAKELLEDMLDDVVRMQHFHETEANRLNIKRIEILDALGI